MLLYIRAASVAPGHELSDFSAANLPDCFVLKSLRSCPGATGAGLTCSSLACRWICRVPGRSSDLADSVSQLTLGQLQVSGLALLCTGRKWHAGRMCAAGRGHLLRQPWTHMYMGPGDPVHRRSEMCCLLMKRVPSVPRSARGKAVWSLCMPQPHVSADCAVHDIGPFTAPSRVLSSRLHLADLPISGCSQLLLDPNPARPCGPLTNTL